MIKKAFMALAAASMMSVACIPSAHAAELPATDTTELCVCGKEARYGIMERFTVPANTTIYLPVEVDITKDSSYAVVSVTSGDALAFGLTDKGTIWRAERVQDGFCRARFKPDAVGTYSIYLCNDTDEDISVDNVSVTNSEYVVKPGLTVEDGEAGGWLHWVNYEYLYRQRVGG